MIKIIKARGKGKTHDLILMSAASGKPIVTATVIMAEHIMQQAEMMGIKNLPKPLCTMEDVILGGRNGILIDDADLVLQEILQVPIVAVTIGEEGTIND